MQINNAKDAQEFVNAWKGAAERREFGTGWKRYNWQIKSALKGLLLGRSIRKGQGRTSGQEWDDREAAIAVLEAAVLPVAA